MNSAYMMTGNSFDAPAMPVHPGGIDLPCVRPVVSPPVAIIWPRPLVKPPKDPPCEPTPPPPVTPGGTGGGSQQSSNAAQGITFDMEDTDWSLRQAVGELIRRLGGTVVNDSQNQKGE